MIHSLVRAFSIGSLAVVSIRASAQIVRTDQLSGTDALLIGVSPVNDRVVWASGVKGTWVRTTDGGTNWKTGRVAGADTLEFRDVHAESADVAWLLAAGNGTMSRIFKTVDGGAKWTQQFMATDTLDFFDCIGFWDAKHGVALGDAVNGRMAILRTDDGGDHWHRLSASEAPAAPKGEGSFAASGLCVNTLKGGEGWMVASSPGISRGFHTMDFGKSWKVDTLPLAARVDAGPTSVTFRDHLNGTVLGGEGEKPAAGDVLVATTDDGGRSWTPRSKPAFLNGVSGGVNVPGARTPTLVAAGYAGVAYSTDGARSWTRIDDSNYWSVGFSSPNAGWAVGPKGRITKLSGF